MNDAVLDLLRSLQKDGIFDPLVLGAIAKTPRDLFISDSALKTYAYEDEALPIECEQTLTQPFVVAYMTERLHIGAADTVLEIGTGSGYQAAIAARLARHVCTMETHLELHKLAQERFDRLGLTNITAIHGDGTKGWPKRRLFDRILVTAGTNEVPPDLLDQLAPCGALIIPLGPPDDQRLTLITRSNSHMERQALLPVRFVPLLPKHD